MQSTVVASHHHSILVTGTTTRLFSSLNRTPPSQQRLLPLLPVFSTVNNNAHRCYHPMTTAVHRHTPSPFTILDFFFLFSSPYLHIILSSSATTSKVYFRHITTTLHRRTPHPPLPWSTFGWAWLGMPQCLASLSKRCAHLSKERHVVSIIPLDFQVSVALQGLQKVVESEGHLHVTWNDWRKRLGVHEERAFFTKAWR